MAMAMAMAQPLCNEKKKMFLFLEPMLQLRLSRDTLTTSALNEAAAGGNGNNSSGGTDSSGYVITLCKQGRLKEALQILDVMEQQSIWVDSHTYAFLLQECVNKKALPEGKLIHVHMIHTGFSPDMYLGTKLVIMYVKCGSLADARRVLDQMPRRNVVSWTAMIAGYAQNGQSEEALALFYQMQLEGIQPNQFTFASVLPACANLGALEHGKMVYDNIIRSGIQPNVFVESALVDMYIKCGSLEDAHHVFDKMSERNVVSWTAMITGNVQNGHVDEALKLFQKMPKRDVISWNAMIAGYAQNGHFNEALKLFQQMRRLTGVKPNSVTFACVLPACANLAALEHGKKVHEDIRRSNFQCDVFVAAALVDMYAKCGSVRDARQVFDKIPKRNVVSWNAMIGGYAMHGYGKEAIQLFEQMQQSGMKPDRVTFLGVLSACCHAGLVDDGWEYFHCMSRDHHITPSPEHYCCMVDLLGRAGQLDEAEDFINNMPIKPDAAVWGSLLGACRIHPNVELGKRVAERLFELDPKNSSRYVLLSNIYAAAGRWDEVEKVQKMMQEMMKDRKVKKRPGCSWIEVNDKVYSFLTGDRSHPQTHKIYAKLEGLLGQMKEAGYVPDMNFVLHDVEVEEKENIVCHHSEKLAIAFGLIHLSPGTPIQIVKNLRVCGDCHSATKFISKIVGRDIVVRDTNRFHHFKDGRCSCGDYW